jgi:hypothetical protein
LWLRSRLGISDNSRRASDRVYTNQAVTCDHKMCVANLQVSANTCEQTTCGTGGRVGPVEIHGALAVNLEAATHLIQGGARVLLAQ